MAGDWIKMRTDLATDPAVFRIAAITKLDRFAVVGRLHAFWVWAGQNTVDGVVDAVAPHVIDEIVGHLGFASALEVVEWLRVAPDTITVPNFERHNGEGAKRRILKNTRQNRWRGGQKGVDAPVDGHVDAPASTREEKRREEYKKETPLPPKGGGVGVRTKKIKPDADPRFERFWFAYPSKEKKQDAAKAFAKLNPSDDLLVEMLEALERQKRWDRWLRGFVPHPTTWLNGKRWEDELPKTAAGPVLETAQPADKYDAILDRLRREGSSGT